MRRELKVKTAEALVLVIVSITLLIYQIKQISFYRLREKQAYSTELKSSYYRTSVESKLELARIRHYFLYSDFNSSFKLYENTLELNPVYLQAWISLTDLLIDNRLDNEARKILFYLDRITGLSLKELWDISIAALRLNEVDLAVRNIALFCRGEPFYEWNRAYYILEKLDNGMELFIKYADDQSIVNYFKYTISADSYDHTLHLWNYINKSDMDISNELVLDYVDYLISHNNLDKAYSIWSGLYTVEGKERDNHIWNGGFESDIINKGFDWRVKNVSGVDVNIEDETQFSGKNSLKITFDGEENINYGNVSVVIPIKGGSNYVFEYAYRSSNITTGSGLYIELSCIDSSKSLVKTDMILGNNNWKKQKMIFNLNNDCSGILLALRRDSINKLDSKIKGAIWLDDFKLMESH